MITFFDIDLTLEDLVEVLSSH